MSKIVKELNKTNVVTNFMNGESFEVDPLTTLKMVCASSIFGEPQYYRKGLGSSSHFSKLDPFYEYYVFDKNDLNTKTFMETTIDKALDYDFKSTIEFAGELRNFYNIRINPQIIMVRAALHKNRVDFNNEYPGLFSNIQTKVLKRADEPSTQLAYYLLLNDNNKNKLPSILKRTWANKLASLNKYQVAKYKNAELGMINTVRICHANSPILDELMQTGNVVVDESDKTWENLRSEGKTWIEILTSDMHMPHMALVRNLHGIFSELIETEENKKLAKKVLVDLVNGVENGKQFPFRYYVAYNIIKSENISYKTFVLEALEKCLQVSLNNMPMLDGKTMVLSDNSGSAWKSIISEYGTGCIAEIGNLSAVLTAMRSEEGYVGVFGDELTIVPISKMDSILSNLDKVNAAGKKVGTSTENGIWLFFENAITNSIHYDNIFIYSDMQAGRGELYCTEKGTKTYYSFKQRYSLKGMKDYEFINVLELVNLYRKNVFNKTNVFSVQTAGYNNFVLPKYLYRGNLLYGWTGKEVVFAKEIIKEWDALEQ